MPTCANCFRESPDDFSFCPACGSPMPAGADAREMRRTVTALVFDGDEAVAWAEYGSPKELPNIYHRKQYEAELDSLPDYRITCIFVDKKYRRKKLSAVALDGALELISQAGGGVVEGYPHDNEGKKMSVLYNGTRGLFEVAGFSYIRPKGPKNCLMRTKVSARKGRRTA